jgi:hypothetical protein
MHRGVEIDIGLTPGLSNDGFVAEALGNLAAFQLSARRNERLQWQVLRVEMAGRHHFRLVVRHPERTLDLGFAHELRTTLRSLAQEDVDTLRRRYTEAQKDGLRPVALRHVREVPDLWHDDFWKWIG